jgi:hypothetical protein
MKNMTKARAVESRNIARVCVGLSLVVHVETCNIRPQIRSGLVLSCVSCGDETWLVKYYAVEGVISETSAG